MILRILFAFPMLNMRTHVRNSLFCVKNLNLQAANQVHIAEFHNTLLQNHGNLAFACNTLLQNYMTKPLVIVTPVHESQIQTVIFCAKKLNIQVRIRGGGHDFEGLSYSSPSPIQFVMIDMINFRSVDVDVASGTAWVGSVAVPEIVTIFAVKRTLEQNCTALLYKWQNIASKLDRDLYIRAELLTVTHEGKRTIQIRFKSLFLGGADRLLLVMKESFPELGLVREDCMEVPWIKSALFFARNTINESTQVLSNRSAIPKLFYKAKSDYVKVPIPVEGLEGLWKRFFQVDDGAITIVMTPYGGKMDEFPESALPFPHRAGNLYMMFISISWAENTTVTEQNKRLNFIRSLYNYLGNYASKNPREAYVNYNDLDIGEGTSCKEASLWGVRYFKDNFKRLVRVKTVVDPDNFFRHEQSIPTCTDI
ncbi:hypothetical protein LguiB_009817 [Lonicera macranthoides]